MPYARRTDRNHADVRDGLRRCGFSVEDYSGLGGGVPDLCVMVKPGVSLFLEVKDPKAPKERHALTKAEEIWFKYNGWNTRKIFSLEEALSAIHQFKRELA